MQSGEMYRFLVQNTLNWLLMNWCKIHSKFSLEQNTRNKEKISPKSKKYFVQKTLYKLGSPKYMISVSSKYMVQNTQCIIHGPVGKHVFWANSPKYIVQNEPSLLQIPFLSWAISSGLKLPQWSESLGGFGKKMLHFHIYSVNLTVGYTNLVLLVSFHFFLFTKLDTNLQFWTTSCQLGEYSPTEKECQNYVLLLLCTRLPLIRGVLLLIYVSYKVHIQTGPKFDFWFLMNLEVICRYSLAAKYATRLSHNKRKVWVMEKWTGFQPT